MLTSGRNLLLSFHTGVAQVVPYSSNIQQLLDLRKSSNGDPYK